MADDKNKQWLYGKLSGGGVNVGSYEQFDKALSDEKNRKWAYDKATSMGLNVGDYDKFNSVFSPADSVKADVAEAQQTDQMSRRETRRAEKEARQEARRSTSVPEQPQAEFISPEREEGYQTYEEEKASQPVVNEPGYQSPLNTETDPNVLRREQQQRRNILNPDYFSNVSEDYSQNQYLADKFRQQEADARMRQSETRGDERRQAKAEKKEAARLADLMTKAADLNPEYQKQLDSANESLDEIGSKVEELSNGLVGDTPRPDPRMGSSYNLTAGNTIASKMMGSEEGRNLLAASNLIDEAKTILNRGNRYTDKMGKLEAFGNATIETLSKPEFWTVGLSTLSDGKRIRAVLEKAAQNVKSLSKEDIEAGNLDKILSPDEMALMDAYLAWGDAQIMRANDQSKGYKAGEMNAQSIAFMRDMMLTAGISGEVNAAVKTLFNGWTTKAGRVFQGLGGNAVRKWATAEGLNLAQKAGRGAVDLAHKSVKNLVASGLDAAVAVNFTPTLYANYSKQLSVLDENSQLRSKKDVWNENWLQNWKEYFTERGIGEAPGQIFRHAGRQLGVNEFAKGLAGEKIATLAKRYSKALRTGKMATAGAFNNVGEYFEEYVGSLMDKYLFGQKDAMVSFWESENLGTMVGGFAPMMAIQAVGAGVNVAAMNSSDRRFQKRKDMLRSVAADQLGINLSDSTWDRFFSSFDTKVSDAENARDIDIAGSEMVDQFRKIHNLIEGERIMGGGQPLSQEEQESLLRAEFDLFKAAAEHNAIQAAYEDQQAEKRKQWRDEIQQSLGGKQFWQDNDGTLEVRTIVTADRGAAYVVGQEQNGQVPVIFLDGTTGFVSGDQITSDTTNSLDFFLDQGLNADQEVRDAASMQEQRQVQVDQLSSMFEVGVESPINGLVPTDILDDGIIFADGTEMTWEQVGEAIGQPINVGTEEDLADAQAGADAAREDENERLEVVINEGLKKKSLIQDATGKTWNIVKVLPGTLDQESTTAKFLLKDGEGNYWTSTLSYDEFINPDMSEPGESAAEVAEESTVQQEAEEAPVQEAPAETGYKIPTTEDGAPDFNRMLEENPAVYASELEKALGEEGRETAKQFIAEKIKSIGKDADAALKKMDTNRVVSLKAQARRYQDVLDSLNAPAEQDEVKEEVKKEVPTFDRLLGNGLSFSDISRYVDNQIARLTGLRDSLEQPVFDGENLDKFESEKAQYESNLAMANSLVSHFEEMKRIVDRVVEAVPSFEETVPREPTPADLEPQNATELAAQMFSNGRFPITIESYNAELLARGAQATGQTGENQKLIGFYRTKENGGHTIQEAAERLIEMRSEGYAGSSFADEDARDIIIDFLSGVETVGDINHYIERQRREQFRQEDEYAAGAMAQAIQEQYGMTVEQYENQLDGLRREYLVNLLENGEEITNFEENEDNGTVSDTEADRVLEEEPGGAGTGAAEGPGVVQGEESPEQTDSGEGSEEAGDDGSDGAPGVLGGSEEGAGAVEEEEVGDMPEDISEEPAAEAETAGEEETQQPVASLTPDDIVEIYNNTSATKQADKGKKGRAEILNALYQANPNLVEFKNEQDQINAIEDVLNLARQYPDLAISKEILSRANETAVPAEESTVEETAEEETPVSEAETSENEENTEEKPSNSEENVVTSQEETKTSPASLTTKEEAQAYFEGLYGKGKKADNATRVWELTHKRSRQAQNAGNGMQQMAFNPEESGLTDEEAAELQQLGIQLAIDYIEQDGFVKFPAFFKNLVETFGDGIRQFAGAIYLGASANVSDEFADQMDDRKTVRDFDTNIDINDIDNEQDTDTVVEQSDGEPAGDSAGGAVGEGEPGSGGVSETGGEPGGSGNDNVEGESASDVSGAGEEGEGQPGGLFPGETGGEGGRTSGSGRGRGGRGSGSRGGRTGSNTGTVSGVQTGGRGTITDLAPTEEQLAAAEQKAYEVAKETWKESEDIASLKSLNESLKQLIEAEKEDSIQKRERMGQRKAVLERLREIFAQQNIKQTDLSQEKTAYVPASDPEGKHAIGSVVPSGASDAMRDAIKKLEDEEGKSIAEFVKDELGYSSLEEMFSDYESDKDTGLSAEQVDSVGLAIHQMKKGRMFIVGDMTGVGKGRQGAALIRWAKKQGKKCLFVTQKSQLFSDMYGDLTDIGSSELLPFVINDDTQANITDKNGIKLIAKPSSADKSALFQSESDELPFNKKRKKRYDFVMMTYSQSSAGEGSRVSNKTKMKLDWIKQYAKDAIVIMDESHTAGGNSNQGKFFQGIAEGAEGVTFMSATYAKRPDNMTLYAIRSSMSEANMTKEALIEAIASFGIPAQEILASNLFRTGEMVRRERDFSDVKTHWPDAKETFTQEEYEECRKTSDKTMGVVNTIIDFQRTYINPTIKRLNEQFDEHNTRVMSNGDGWVKEYRNTSYAGQVSNVVGLMLYDMKARKAAEMAIEQIKKGEKPVIAVENTLGSYVDQLGDNISSANFAEVIRRGLRNTLKYTLVEKQYKDGKPVPEADGGIRRTEFESIAGELDGPGVMSLGSTEAAVEAFAADKDKMELPLSPIDYIKQAIADAGYKCGEITGRSNQLVRNADGTYSKVALKVDKKKAARQFNGGDVKNPLPEEERLDALILNVAGATGISLHASSRFGDQRKRNMIILQAARDVNTEVQMRGRVDRTGQVSRAEYFYLTSPVPAEQKLTMMLRQKLASLDANSVGTEDVSSNRVDADDMDNKYGDQVAEQYLLEHLQDINNQLDNGLKFNNKTKEWEGHEGLLYDLMKDMQRLTCEEQEQILSELQTRYVERIEYLNQNGINDLKTTTLNLEAQTIDVGVFVKGKDNESPSEFAHDTNIERVEVNVLKKPLRSDDINKKMKQLGAIDGEGKLIGDYGIAVYTESVKGVQELKDKKKAKHAEAEEKILARLRKEVGRAVDQSEEDYEQMLKGSSAYKELVAKNQMDYANFESELLKQDAALTYATGNLTPGKPYLVPLTDDISNTAPMMYGRFMGFKTKGGKPRGTKAIFAVKDSRAMIDIPVVTMEATIRKIVGETYSSIGINEIGGSSWRITNEERRAAWDEWWDKMIPRNTSRQIRYMVTGNIIQACGSLGKYKGTITTFTRKDKETGEITTEKGMLLAEDFDPENFKVRSKVTKEDVWKSYDSIKDTNSNIVVWRSGDKLQVKFQKRKGQKLADHPINSDEDFKKLTIGNQIIPWSRDELYAEVAEDNAETALEHLFKEYGFTREHLFVMPDSTERVDAIVYTGKPYQEVIDELGAKYGLTYKFEVEREISQALKTYKMDVNNDALKEKIRELVQLRQAYYRKDATREDDTRLAWKVLSYDQQVELAGDDKRMRDHGYNMREAVLEELAERGIKGTEKHYEQGKMSLDDLISIFNEFNKNEENAEIAKKVFAIAKDLNLDIVLGDKIDVNIAGQTAGQVVEYNWKFFNAKYITDQMKADTILHELVHTMTVYAKSCIDGGYEHLITPEMVEVVNELDNIYKQIWQDANFTHDTYTDYGVSNWFEMMSEAGSNEKFRDDLRKTMLVMRNKSGFITFFNQRNNKDMQGKVISAYEAVRERLDYLLDNFNKNGFKEYFRGTSVGDRYRNEMSEDDFIPSTPDELDEKVNRMVHGDVIRESDINTIEGRAEIVYRANDLANKFGVGLRGNSGLNGKAVFHTDTGEIEVNFDRHNDISDAEATVFHEVVGHLGLRRMFGEEFGNAMSEIYAGAHESIREQIDAMREQIAKEKKARGEAPETSLEEATEEYLAELAEDGINGEMEQSLWQRIKQAFFNMLRRAGVNIPLTDEDLMYVLWQSKRNLENTDHLSILELADRALMRDALRRQAESSHNPNPEDNGPFDGGGGGVRYRSDGTSADDYYPTTPFFDRKEYYDRFENAADREEKRSIIKEFIDKIDPHHGRVDVVYQDEKREFFANLFGDMLQKVPDAAREDTLDKLVLALGKTAAAHIKAPYSAIVIFPDRMKKLSSLISDYAHEWTHLDNELNLRPTKLAIALKKAGIDALDELEKVAGLEARNFYEETKGSLPGASSFYADEIIAYSMMWAYHSGKSKLKDFGFEQETLNFIEKYYDERSKAPYRAALQGSGYDRYHLDGSDSWGPGGSWRSDEGTPGEVQRGGRDTESPEGPVGIEGQVRYRSIRHKPNNPRVKRTIVRNTTTDEENDIALRAYNRAANNVFTRFGESFIDMMNSLAIARDAMVKESGREMKDSEDFVTSFNTMSSRMHAMSQRFADRQLKAMREAIKDITDEFEDIELEDISRYVSIKSGLERNVEFAKRDAREWYQEEYRKEVEKVSASDKLSDDEKQDKIEELRKALEQHLQDIKDGTDAKLLEYRKDDYGGISGWMSRYEDHAGNPIDELPGMEPGESVEEYNARIRRMRHPLPGAEDLAGAEALAEAQVADFERKITKDRADALWKSINDCTKHILRTQYKSNVISKAQFDSLIDRLKYYVPLRGFEEDTAGDIYSYYGADERRSFLPPLLRAGGRMSRPDSPFGYIAGMADSAFSEAAKNDSKRALYRFISNRKNNSFATIADSYYRKTGRQNAKGGDIYEAVNAYTEIDPDTGKPYVSDDMSMKAQREGFDKFKEAMLSDEDVIKGKKKLNLRDSVAMITDSEAESHIVRVKVLGEEYEMVFHGNPRMAQAINGELNSDSSDNPAKRVLRFLASMSTSRNPAFWIDNFRRDFITSVVNLAASEDGGYVARVTGNLKHAFRTIQLYLNNGEIKRAEGTKLSELESLWNQFVDNGGITGMAVISRHDQVDKQIADFIKTGRWHGKDESWFVKHSGAVGEWIKKVGDFGESIEQVIRFATFVTSRQMGRGINRSIRDAKEVTVNFNRKGSGKAITREEAKTLGYSLPNGRWHKLTAPEQMLAIAFSSLAPIGRNIILFFNANMQGLYRQVQNFKSGPVKTTAMMAGLTMLGFGSTLLAGLLGGGDDDEKEYFRISEYNRNHRFAIPAFWSEDTFFLWPVPPEFAPFYEIGNIWGDALLKRRPDQNPVWASLAAMGQILPVNPAEPTSIIPAQAKPIVESAMNRNYMGQRLHRGNDWNKDMPGYTKAFNNTWDWLVDLSELANTVSGGDYATKGWMNFNPAVAQHLIEGFGGGLLTFLGQIVTTAEDAVSGKPVQLRTTPIANRFFLNTDEYMRDSYINTEYYHFKGIADQTKSRLNKYQYNKPDEDYVRVQQVLDSKDYRYLELYNDYKEDIDAYQEDIKNAADLEERRQLMAEQDELKKAFVDECIEIFYSKD